MKWGGALVESTEADEGTGGRIGFEDDNKLGDCCRSCEGAFGDDTYVIDGPFAPEFVLRGDDDEGQGDGERRNHLFRCEWLSSDSDLFRFRSSVSESAGLALGELACVDDGVVRPIRDSLSP